MPVMIRYNLATELCITKGQEGFVYDWIEGVGKKGQRIIRVLFVKLQNPPFSVKLSDLPEVHCVQTLMIPIHTS